MRISNKLPQYLLDANFLVALLDARDVHHARAVHLLTEIQTVEVQFFISDAIINEVLSVFAKRCESKGLQAEFANFTKRFRAAISDYPILCLYELIPTHYKTIITTMTRHQGRFNFHDVLILLFLKEVPKVHLVTFDQDFQEIRSLKVIA